MDHPGNSFQFIGARFVGIHHRLSPRTQLNAVEKTRKALRRLKVI
jgi:hypothetical protein